MTTKTAPRFISCLLVALAAGCGQGVTLDPGGGGHIAHFPAAPCGQLGTGSASAVAYAPGGQQIAAAYGSGAVVIYKATDGSAVQRLAGHDSPATALAYSPDGALLASAAEDGTINVWRTADGSLAWNGVMFDLPGGVSSLAFSPDGALVASTGISGMLNLSRASDGAQVWSVSAGSSQQTVFFTADGASVVSHPYGGALVQLRGVSDGAVTREIVLADSVRLGAMSPDGSLLFGYVDNVLPLGHAMTTYRTTDGARAWFVDGAHGNNIMGVAVSPDGATVASASWDGTVKLWRASDGNALRTITETGPASSVAFSPDSTAVAGGTTAGDVQIFGAASGASIAAVLAPPGHSGNVFQLTFSPDGSLLASVALSDGDQVDRSAKIWRTSDGALLRTLPDVGEQTTQRLAFSPDGSMVVAGETDGRIHLVRLSDGAEVASVGSSANEWSVLGVAMSPDGTLIAASCRCVSPSFRPVRLWRLDGTEDLGVGDLGQIASGFAFSPDGATLAVAVGADPADATTIKVLRLSDRSQVWQANLASPSPVVGVSLAFSPDGSTIAAGSLFGANVTVFRASDGQVLRATLFGSDASGRTIGQIGFSGDGSLLGVATYAGLNIFHTTDWSLGGGLGQSNSFIGAALSPTASRAAAAGQSGVIYQWCNLGQ